MIRTETNAEMFPEDFKKFDLLKNIRWIASRSRALNFVESNHLILIHDLEQKPYNQSETGKKALGFVKFMKQPKFLFYLHFLQDLVETMRPLSLKFQQNDLLSCRIQRIIVGVSSSIEASSLTSGPSYIRLMTELHLYPECSYELLYKDVILEKPDGRRDAKVEHNPKKLYILLWRNLLPKNYIRSKAIPSKSLCVIQENTFKRNDYNIWLQGVVQVFRRKQEMLIRRCWKYGSLLLHHHFITEEENAAATRHWISFRNKIVKLRNDKLIDVYSDLLRERDNSLSGIIVLFEIMITVSTSTAACKRGFSCFKRQKTNIWTSLSQSLLDDVLRICIDRCELKQLNAENNI